MSALQIPCHTIFKEGWIMMIILGIRMMVIMIKILIMMRMRFLKLFAGALRRQTSKRGSVATCLRKTKAWNPSGTHPLLNRQGIYFEFWDKVWHNQIKNKIYCGKDALFNWKAVIRRSLTESNEEFGEVRKNIVEGMPFQRGGIYETKFDRIQ